MGALSLSNDRKLHPTEETKRTPCLALVLQGWGEQVAAVGTDTVPGVLLKALD